MPLSAPTDCAALAALEEHGLLGQAKLGRRVSPDGKDVSTVRGGLEGGAAAGPGS